MNVKRVNMEELLSRVEQDRELLHELLSIFVDEFPVKLQELREAIAHENLMQTVVASHALKGMLSNMSVVQGASSAAQIEQIARNGQTGALRQALAAFENEVQGLVGEFQTHLAEVSR
jgi:HPt (histidine-containing phosphotransfer) domain-containing protein